MAVPTLYRRRFIPNELVHLKDDIILISEKNFIITKWNSLHPRKDIARGISAYYIDQGYKVSKIFDKNGHVVYWYFDIIQAKYGSPLQNPHESINSENENTVIIEDLLLDVILYEDGTLHIRDLDELSDALEQGLITQAETTYALRTLNSLLKIIYEGHIDALQKPVNYFDEQSSSSSI
jgi:predicted RNA-binding protein associated with RNAse of E/G family